MRIKGQDSKVRAIPRAGLQGHDHDQGQGQDQESKVRAIPRAGVQGQDKGKGN